MKKPICNSTSYKSFTVSKNDARKHKIYTLFTELALEEWSNLDTLVKKDTQSFDGAESIKRFKNALAAISQNLNRYPYVQKYATQVKQYLETDRVNNDYLAKFQEHYDKKASRRSKRKLNNETRLLSESEVLLQQKKQRLKVQSKIVCVEASLESPAASSSSSSETLAEPSSSTRGINIHNIIHDAAVALHVRYQKSEKLTPNQLKTMACGLSSILDINSDEMNGSQQLLFDEALWKKIYSKYTKKHTLNIPPLPTELDQQWNLICNLCRTNKDARQARHLICTLKLASATVQQDRTLDLLNEVIFQIESKQFMFDETNSKKLSERDFAYQLWLPLLSKLFFINNIVRIKVGETVLAGTSFSKSLLYHDAENVVGFKVDIRILVDYKKDEFDLMCGEACSQNAGDDKVQNDGSKLIREGKEMQRSLQHVFYDESNVGYVWMVQVKGPKCSFSTLHPTQYCYHVSIPQFEISFPTAYSLLDENANKFIARLLTFRSSVEKSAVEVEKKLKDPFRHQSPIRNQQQPSSSTWFTPPRKVLSTSRVPANEAFESEETFDSDDESASQDHFGGQPDKFGFVKRGQRWFNIHTNDYWDSYPGLD
jgi:hypothetical protein